MGLDSSDELGKVVTVMNKASTLLLTTNQRQNMQGNVIRERIRSEGLAAP